jgi:hypothetical protein
MKAKVLIIIINARQYEWKSQYITGAELKQLAGMSLDRELYLSIAPPWVDELINNDTSVDLARPGIEHFYIRHQLKFTINGVMHESKAQYITGLQIRELGKIATEDDIYLKIKPPYEDELIANDTRVDLARPGIEHFISKEKPFNIVLIVNGSPKPWVTKTISFAEVVALADIGPYNENGQTAYTVTYMRGPVQNPQGSMVKGNIVHVKDKMIFNVTATNKS